MATKPVIVQLKNGAVFGVDTPSLANKTYPDGKIIGHQDGTPYVAPKPTKAKGTSTVAKSDKDTSSGVNSPTAPIAAKAPVE